MKTKKKTTAAKKLKKKKTEITVKKRSVKSTKKLSQKRKQKNAQKKSLSKKTRIKTKPKTKKIKVTVKKRVAKKTTVKTKTQTSRNAVKILTPAQKTTKRSEEERRTALRKVLIQKREEILKEAKNEISKYIKGETRQLVDTALDDGDWSIVDLSEDISLRQLGSHREKLQKIDEALRKLNEGTYGICEDCGEEISSERLKILPFAIFCIDCQEKRERFEEMEKREVIS